MNRIVTRLTFNIIRPIGNEGANSQTFLAFDPQLNAELVVKSIPKQILICMRKSIFRIKNLIQQ